MKQPNPLLRKLAEEKANVQSQYSIDSASNTVGLDTEETNSLDTRHGNVTAPILSNFTSTAEMKALEYQNSEAKKEIDLINKKELDDTTKQIEDVDKAINELQTNKDNFEDFTNPLDVESGIGPKAVLGSKGLKPEVQQQIDELKSQKLKLAKDFDNHPELQTINDKIKTLEDKYTFKNTDKDVMFLDNPLSWYTQAQENVWLKVVNTFSNPEKKMTSQEKAEYTKLKAQRDTFYKPIAEEKIRQRDEDATNLRAKLYEANQDGESRSIGDKLRLLTAARKAELNKKELEAYVNGEDGSDAFFRKLSLYTASSKGGLMEDMVQNISDYTFKDELQKKADEVGYDNLSKEEQDILYTYSTTDEDKNFLADKQKWSYNTIDQTMHSVGFVRDIVIADAITGGIGGAVVGSTAKVGLKAGTKMLKVAGVAKKGRTLLARGTAMAVDGGVSTGRLGASIAVENHLNPEYLNNELMKGSYIDRDEKGQVKNIFVKEGYHKMMVEAYKNDFINFENIEKTLEAKERLTKDEEEQLRHAKVKLGKVNDIGEHSLQEELDLFKPLSGMDAEMKGFGKMASERLAEVYTGRMFSVAGKTLRKIPGVDKFATKGETLINNASSAFKATKVGRLYDGLGKGTRKLLTDGQGNAIVNSLPAEILEEYVTAGMNSAQDGDLKELHDMFDVQANIDIAAQTFLMTSMFGGLSNVQTNSKLLLNKLATSRIKSYEEKLKELNDKTVIPSRMADIKARRIEALSANSDDSNVASINKEFDNEEKEFTAKHQEDILKTQERLDKIKEGAPSYFGANVVAAITGGDSTFQSTRNYITARKEVRKSIAQLKAANTNQEVADIVNLMTTSGFGISDVKAKADALKAQGKLEEAKLLETTMFQKLVFDSFKGGVQDELKTALGKLHKNTKLDEETRQRALKAEQNLDELNKVYEKYSNKPNVGAITNFAFEKMLLKEGISEVEESKSKLADTTLDEIKAFATSTNQPIDVNDISMSTLFTRTFEDAKKNENYQDFLQNLLSSNNLAVENYAGLENSSQVLKQQLANSMVAFNEAITPSQETINKENFLKKLQENYESIEKADGKFTSTEANFNYNNQLEQTPELIDDLFNQMEKESVGKTMDGKVSKETFNELRSKFKQRIEDRKELEKFKTLLQAQKEITAKRDEEVTTQAPDTITVVDNEAEEEFTEAYVVNLDDTANLFDDSEFSDPDTFDATDEEFDLQIDNQFSDEQIKAITGFVKTTVESIESKLGRRPTFREFMEQAYKYAPDKNKVKKIFNASIEGWKANNYEADNYQQVYDDLFDTYKSDVTAYVETINNLFETEVATEPEGPYNEVDEKINDAIVEVANKEAVTVSYDEENLPVVKTLVDDIESQRTLNIDPKLGFSAILYDEVIENGVLKRVTRGSNLNISPDSLIDFRDLLNPETYKTGDKLQLEIADESLWSQITVSDGRDENGEVKTTTFDKWVASRQSNNPQFRTSQEFLNKRPIFYTSSAGKRLAYVQDVDWYNPFNVGNPYGDAKNPDSPTQEWLQYIEQGKKNTEELRNNINRGLKEVSITKPEDGKFHKIPEDQPLITVQESNPQTIIAVQRGTDLHTSFDKMFTDGILLNTNLKGERGFNGSEAGKKSTNSHTWMVNRVGFTLNDKGETVPTYRAYPVMRTVNPNQIETVKWALAAHLALKGESWGEELNSEQNKVYKLNVEQAKKIQKDIFTNMSYDIENPKGIINFIKIYFQTEIQGDVLSSYRKVLFNSEDPFTQIKQHTLLGALDNKNVKNIVHIANGVVTPTGMKYEDYLKSSLLTNIKSFNVASEDKPVYATVIQPIINISYSEVEQTVTPRQQAANDVIEQLQTESKEVNEPFDISKHINFLNRLHVDIDSFEQGDEFIENTDKLANIFKLPNGLNILQEKAIRQFIVHSIGEKASFDYKAMVDFDKTKLQIMDELKAIINPLQAKINEMLKEVKEVNNAEHATLVAAYESTLNTIKAIQSNFSSIYEKAWRDIQKQTSLVLSEMEAEEEESNDETLSLKDYTKDSIEESGKSKASYRLRRFLHKIPTYDNKGNVETTFLGLPLYMSFNDVYNELSKELALGNEVVSDYDLIIDKLKQSKSRFVKDILSKLEKADQQIKNEFVYNFVRHSLISKFAMFETGTKDGIVLKVYDTNANEASRIIQKKWLNEHKASDLFDSNANFNVDYAKTLLDEYEQWDKDYKNVPETDLRTWLGKLGFQFEDGAWKQIYDNGIWNSQKQNNFNALYTQTAGGLFVPIINFLRSGITKPAEHAFDAKNTVFKTLRGVTNALSLIEAQYNPNLIALSFRDSGKNISTQVPTKYITDMVQNLKRSSTDDTDSLISKLQELSFSSDSITLELLKTNSEFKRLFEVSHLSLTAVKEKGSNPSKAGITDLSDIDYDLATLTGFMDRKGVQFGKDNKVSGISVRMAHMMFPTMSDKTTGLFLRTAVFDFLKDSNLLFSTVDDQVTIGDEIKDVLFNQLVLPELKRIMKFHKDVKSTNIKNYDNGAMLFHFIPSLNTLVDTDGVKLIEKLASLENEKIEDIIEKYGEAMKESIEKVVTREVEHKMNQWSAYTKTNQNGDTFSDMFDSNYFKEVDKNPAKDYKIAVYDYVMNSMLHNAEVFKVFAGDIANYSQDKLYKENGKKVLPYQMEEGSSYISLNKEIGVNLGKRLALLIAPGNKVANSYNEQYNQIFLEDAIDISENIAYLVKNYYGDDITEQVERYRKAQQLINRHEQGEIFINPDRYNAINNVMIDIRNTLADKYTDLAAYFDIESTDAQEYSTMGEHLSLMHRTGRISDKDKESIESKIANNEDLSKEELNIVFQPIKPVHTGSYINKDFDINQIVYIKSSSFPLIPQLTRDNKLDNLRKKMEELEKATGRFTRASFQSANKVGATKKAVNPFDVNSLVSVKEYNSNDINATVRVLNRNNFRIQQDVPFKSDKKQTDTVSMGTQFFKLLFGDGMDKVNDFRLHGNPITGKDLYAHYNKAFATIVETKKQQLFAELGLDTQGRVQDEMKFMRSLQNLLVEEATNRGYSLKSLAGLKIEQLAAKAGQVYYEFKTPLWLSSDSNRYESLLNAIITNRLMKHKMPGNGFVAGSESGFKFKENLKDVDKSRIIYLNGWNGKELQGAHTIGEEGDYRFQTAQVFAPSKFKNTKGELVDLFEGFNGKEGKYIQTKEDGTLTLKKGMIEPEILNMFTFRTPTSSHVSGSSVTVVGILPPESGDLMIVPKNFTKQKGLDYDIDKESAYMLNHITNYKTGKIEVLNKRHVAKSLEKLRLLIEDYDLQKVKLQRRSTITEIELDESLAADEDIKPLFTTPEIIDILNMETLSALDKLNRLRNKLDIKLAENEFIRTHLAVFNNSNPIVQNKINKVLSIDFAKQQALSIEKLEAEGEKNKVVAKYVENGLSPLEAEKKYQSEAMDFSMLTYTYQKNKMSLGSIGKIAIGVYANYTTFNGLLQQNDDEIYMQDENGYPRQITIGKSKSDGILGKERTIDGERTTAEVFAEKENTATDNEKEQVLGRVGVNENTINVDAFMTLRGFDKDENGNSISYMLLSQPIIKELNKRRKDSKGILGEYIKDDNILVELIDKYSKGVLRYIPTIEPFEGTIINPQIVVEGIQGNVVTENFIKDSQYDGNVLLGDAMLDGIKYNGDNPIVQLAALKTYLNLEIEARTVANIQKTVNVNNLGKSMIESQIKYSGSPITSDKKKGGLMGLAETNVKNVEKLLGDFSEEQGDKTGGQWIGAYYVTPTTPQGQIVINGLHIGNTLYKNFFPYQEDAILKVVKEIAAAKGREDVPDSTVVDSFETIIEGIRKYIYSRQGNNIFNVDPKAKRYELFKDDANNVSLSTYLKDILKADVTTHKKGIKSLKQNALIKSFTFETGKGDTEISTINYNNAATDNLDEEDMYNAIPEMVMNNAPLPDRNGKPYNTMMLAEDLVAYAFLEGGVQEATQFIKYVPVEFIESVGQIENGVFVPANRKLQGFNIKRNKDINIFNTALGIKGDDVSIFTKQYFQHNPTEAARVSYKVTENKSQFNYVNEAGISPSFVSMKNLKTAANKFALYQHMGNGNYQEIDTLGNIGISEYHYREENVTSMKSKTLPATTPVLASSVNNPVKGLEVNEKTTLKGLLGQVANYDAFAPEYAHLKEAAKWLEPLMKEEGVGESFKGIAPQLILTEDIGGAGIAMRESFNIKLRPSLTINESDEKTALVFIHELIHTVSAKELSKYYESDGVTLKSGTVPSYVTNLNAVFSYFVKQHKKEIDVLNAKMKEVKDNPDSPVGIQYTDREKSFIYAGTSIFEFVTVALTSPLFQEEMNKMPYAESGKSVMMKIKEILLSLLKSIFPNIVENTVAEAAILTSMDFINEEASLRKTMQQESLIPLDVQYELDTEEANNLVYGEIDYSNEIDNIEDEFSDPDEDNADSGTEKYDLMIEDLKNLPNFEPCN